MNSNTLSKEARIRLALADLRSNIDALTRRWRLRRVGAEVRRSFAAIDAALLVEPAGNQTAFLATLDLVELLESRAPAASAVVNPVLDAAHTLFRVIGGVPVCTDLGELPPAAVGEFLAAMATENQRQAAGHPPSADCPICAVLARHGLPTADDAMLCT